jgi:AraC-like DNA-binding protein
LRLKAIASSLAARSDQHAKLIVPMAVVLYQHKLRRSPGEAERVDTSVDPRSFGIEMEDLDGHLRVERLSLGEEDAVVSRLTSTGYRGILRDDDNFTFVLQREGRYAVRISDHEYCMYPGNLLAFRPNERQTRVRVGKTGIRRATTLQLPVKRMNDLARAMDTSVALVFPRDGFDLHGAGGQTLKRILPHVSDDMFLRPSVPLPTKVLQEFRYLIDEVLCELIGRTAAQQSSRRIFPAFHRVRQAEELMYAYSGEPISMLELAEAVGVSLRSLQLAFADVYNGQSPREVLNRIRLDKARERLLAADGDGQVTTIALDSGFFHLGRFSQAYARAFGERPSETLARRRA